MPTCVRAAHFRLFRNRRNAVLRSQIFDCIAPTIQIYGCGASWMNTATCGSKINRSNDGDLLANSMQIEFDAGALWLKADTESRFIKDETPLRTLESGFVANTFPCDVWCVIYIQCTCFDTSCNLRCCAHILCKFRKIYSLVYRSVNVNAGMRSPVNKLARRQESCIRIYGFCYLCSLGISVGNRSTVDPFSSLSNLLCSLPQITSFSISNSILARFA